MKRGWRNDPAWIAHYAKRDEDRAQRAIQRMKFEFQMEQANRDLEASLERMRRPTLGLAY